MFFMFYLFSFIFCLFLLLVPVHVRHMSLTHSSPRDIYSPFFRIPEKKSRIPFQISCCISFLYFFRRYNFPCFFFPREPFFPSHPQLSESRLIVSDNPSPIFLFPLRFCSVTKTDQSLKLIFHRTLTVMDDLCLFHHSQRRFFP